ncbi:MULTISPECIES: asparagine synthase-related protein [unclassified Sphingomonas]|uniref:asparagine synthase-related protein n=1 Tax=unclassified Sphingomonas TaxID=196159 RepID=UPI00082A72DB|nr:MULTISPECIES: asparagine synthetase B family protein [unclassified Sphingomonas]
MDRTGLYGLFDLDGAPPDAAAAAILGLGPDDGGSGGVAAVIDLADPGAAQCAQDDGALTLFLGRLDEPVPVARQLGLSPETPHVEIARAALARYGSDIRALLHGEWTLVRWDGRAVVMVASLALRDPLLYAVRGRRIAIGPDLRQLSQISWVGDRFDPAGLFMALGRPILRPTGDARTPVEGICALDAGEHVTIDRQGVRTAPPVAIGANPDWRGDLNAAMAEAAEMILRIVRQRMVGGNYACMLSGGLDSATLAWATAQALHSGEQLRFLTSAAAPGTDQIDEVAEAAIVAAHLGIAHEPVVTTALPGPYRPDPKLFRDANGPSLSVRHYLYHRFAEQCHAAGSNVLFDGLFGELTFSNPLPLHRRESWWRAARQRLRTSAPRPGPAFHVYLAPHWLAQPPAPLRETLQQPASPMRLPEPGALWGVSQGIAKAVRSPASLDLGRVRVAMPFRDPRLIALFAGFPAAMLYPEPGARTPARRLLAGKLPDSIVQRGKGPGFAPDYMFRLRSEAEAARAQIPLFRRAGADEWIDLEALDRGLAHAARGATADYSEAVRVQLTALAGAFFAWWRGLL